MRRWVGFGGWGTRVPHMECADYSALVAWRRGGVAAWRDERVLALEKGRGLGGRWTGARLWGVSHG